MLDLRPVGTERRITIRVTPKASSNRIITGEKDGPDFKIYVTTVPEDGKANKAVLKLLAKYLNVPKSSLSIAKGAIGRDKIIVISDS